MREIFIERQSDILRIAIKNKDRLEEFYIEEDENLPVPGEIYKGIVKNVVPAIKSAFVDIGYKKHGYMYLDSKFNNKSVKKGDELIVEVIKEELGDKGPKVSSAFTIAGRYCVLNTLDKELVFSKKISNESFICSLKDNLKKPEDVGILIRTNAESTELSLINKEVDQLYEEYKRIILEARFSANPALLYGSGGVIDKVLRDNVDETVKRMVVSNESDYEHIKKYINSNVNTDIKLELHEESRSLFDYYGIEKELMCLRNKRVQLLNGGYIVIEKTEAMYVVDVNSGKNLKSNTLEKTAYLTNLTAAEEICRQIRLRNLSGIIVIDFIDMNNEEYQGSVIKKLKEGFEGDKNKTVIYRFTELNLVQIARRRRGKTLEDYLEESCSQCHGSGKVIKFSIIKNAVRNEVLKISKDQGIKDIYIELDEHYKSAVQGDLINFIKGIEALDKAVYVNFIQSSDHIKVEPIIFANQLRNLQSFKIYG